MPESEHVPRTPQEAFCARLRAARERRGITLRGVADATKVTTSLFEALERGDVSRWPKGIYKRSFFRGYVAAIGLPPESTTEEFLRFFPDEKPAAAPEARQPADGQAEPPMPLRLTLAPDLAPVPLHRRVSRAAAVDILTVVAIALALAWWAGVDPAIGLAFAALGFYPHLSRVIRKQAASWSSATATVRPAPEQARADTEAATANAT